MCVKPATISGALAESTGAHAASVQHHDGPEPARRPGAIERVHLPPGPLASIRAHARAAYPAECCGFLIGRRAAGVATVEETRMAVNRCEDAPERQFVISPLDYLRAEREAEARGLSVLGFYHSHPDAPPEPSATDLRFAWPNTVYLITSVWQGDPSAENAFVLADDAQAFRAITITEAPHG
jgi:proteasome lid subunit RPN8/RPN11